MNSTKTFSEFMFQLKLLLWKNWLLRKRNKFRGITEVLWPLIMMLVVVLLHEVGEKRAVPSCHTKAKAMPSAGEVLFLQTFFCTINNTCSSKNEEPTYHFSSSLVFKLAESFQETLSLTSAAVNFLNSHGNSSNHTQVLPEQVHTWVKDFVVIESLIEAIKMHQLEKQKVLNESVEPLFISLLDNITEPFFEELEERQSKKFLNNSEDSEAFENIQTLSRMKRKVFEAGFLDSFQQSLGQKTKSNTPSYGLNILHQIFCGPEEPSLLAQINSVIESGKKRSKENEETETPKSKYIMNKFEWENDTTTFCNEVMKKLDSAYSSRIVFRLLKPLIRGKLIYTPNAPVINRMMSRINETFLHVKMMIGLIKNAIETSEEINILNLKNIINKYKNEEFFLQKIAKSRAAKTLLKHFNNENEADEIMEVQKILDETVESWKTLSNNSSEAFDFSSLIPYLECFDLNRLIAIESEELAVKEALKWLSRERLWGLIVFANVSSDAEVLPPSITYKIRMDIERTPDTNQIRDRVFVPKMKRNVIYDLREVTGGFAYLQNAIEGEMIKEYTGRLSLPAIYLKQMPYPCHVYDSFSDVVTRTFPMFMVISWTFIFCMVSKRIVHEKEILFKGTLRIFGVSTTQHWISWFVDAFVPMVFVTGLLSILLVKGGLIPNSSIFVVWLFLTAFVLPTITLAFLVSTFFFKASFAMAVSGMIYFLLYLPYPPIENYAEVINPYFKIFVCLISNVAFGLGCTWIANMEEIGVGAQLDKITYSPVPGNPITMALILQMLLIDSFIYLMLALYLDNVLTSNDFVSQPWYYCFTLSYWRSGSKNDLTSRFIFPEDLKEKNSLYFEPDPEGLVVGIEVVNLTKEFTGHGEKKKVVNNVSIKFYEDQITSFLGQNGAGKTTAILMMIGLIPITRGTVRIYGVNIKKHPYAAVKDLGICRQENVLLNDLTVEEHFKLFAKLKNRASQIIDLDVKKFVEDLHLGSKAHQPVKTLSEGMKRKVCVAMAFIGGSRTVFLDEPTAGVDPYSRRSIWELLIKYKKGRTIILTTHFLDEADLLADRIAIISSGKLKCCGTSIFLKSRLGKGYYLTLEKPERLHKGNTNLIRSHQAGELENFIKKTIPKVEFVEEVGSEIVFIIPPGTKAEDFNTLFVSLDANKEILKINSYGITDTSLEEIFMRVLLEDVKEQDKCLEQPGKTQEPIIVEKSNTDATVVKMSGIQKVQNCSGGQLWKEQFIALFIKRFLHHRRNFKVVLIEVVLPASFMAIALALVKTLPSIKEMPPLVIDMSAYNSSSLFYTIEGPRNPRLSSYEEELLSPRSFGTKCTLYPGECSLKAIPRGSLVAGDREEYTRDCSCREGFFECFDEKSKKDPPSVEISSGDVLYNLTGLNLTNWLISTEFENSGKRFGGISFGHFTPLTGLSISEFFHLFVFHKLVKAFSKFNSSDEISISGNSSYGDNVFSEDNLSDGIVIWFNNRGWIASLAMMNGISNLVLRASLPNNTDPSKYSITLLNHPLPITRRQLEDQIEFETNVALLCALSVIWALSFIPAMYAVYLVEERTTGLKNLQIVSGISRLVYWCSNLIWDLTSYSFSVLAIVLLHFLFQMNAFIGKESIGGFILLLYSYGFVNIAFVYIVSFTFSVSSTAFVFIACWNILTGVTTLLSTFTLTLIFSRDNPYYLDTIFMIFPQYCFGKSLINMALESIRKQLLENFGVKLVENYISWHLTLKYVVLMLLMGGVFFAVSQLLEYQILQKYLKFTCRGLEFWKEKRKPNCVTVYIEEDEDVRKERDRVESGRARDDGDVLIINNLTKVYMKHTTPAVDHICLGLKVGECFGLLGLNGAGKTTVFRMLTGSVSPTEGDALVKGFSIRRNPVQIKHLIGYCPQNDALDPYLTAHEHFSFFCRIRGVTTTKRKEEVSLKIKRLGLTEHSHKLVKVLSGGNKRKVNMGIALVCDPELVLLDEPTSGMDALSRRFLWDCLQSVISKGRCAVLTSHSMEECEALCTHLSIMINGRFACFGSNQHLKNKFGEGYSITVRLLSFDNLPDLMNHLEENLPGSTKIRVDYLQVQFKLSPTIFIGDVFTCMGKAKDMKLIQDYSVSETTLDNIFLRLAMIERN